MRSSDTIKPYDFVPFPQEDGRAICLRSEPPGHHRLESDAYSGVVNIRWTSLSPVVLPVVLPDGERVSDVVQFPGSTAKGAVRSLHETLVGGCLRVIDDQAKGLPKALLPCNNADELCRSCRIFGSAGDDTNLGEGEDENVKQTSYRSHLRFSPVSFARSRDDPRGRNVQIRQYEPNMKPAQVERPFGYRGRKYYWSAIPHAKGHYRTKADGEHVVTLLETPSIWYSTIHFENLTLGDLGGLMAAQAPQHLFEYFKKGENCKALEEKKYTARLGRGKPLGLGIFRTKVDLTDIYEGSSRYRGAPVVEKQEVDKFKETAVDVFVEETPEAVQDTWPELAKMLNTGSVDSSRVGYPTRSRATGPTRRTRGRRR